MIDLGKLGLARIEAHPAVRRGRLPRRMEDHSMSSITASDLADRTAGSILRDVSHVFEAIGAHVVRYGLVLVLVWIGAMKFTAYEAEGIQGLVANSPLMSWMYNVLSVRGTSALIGSAELIIAGLIALRPLSAALAALGSALAVGMFMTTLSFMASTPGVFEASAGGFPALSVLPGQFLLKDVVLLAVAFWSLAEAWNASMRDAQRRSATRSLQVHRRENHG
jgi:uncharacterized membrane protein YkgB